LVDGGRNEFFGDGPLKHPANASDPLVDESPTPVRVDELLPNRFESQRTEFGSGAVTVQFADIAHDDFVLVEFVGGPIRPTIVDFSEVGVGQQHLVDAHAIAVGRPVRRRSQFELQLANAVRDSGIVWPGKEFLVPGAMHVSPDRAGAAGLLVEEVGGCGLASIAHVAGSSPPTVERFHSSPGLEAAPGTRRGKRETLRLKGFRRFRARVTDGI
jgi:hypothetical protein